MHVQVARWGNSLGVRIPRELARGVGLTEGTRVDIAAECDRIIIMPRAPRYTLDQLLQGMTPEAMHAAYDWGPGVSREDMP